MLYSPFPTQKCSELLNYFCIVWHKFTLPTRLVYFLQDSFQVVIMLKLCGAKNDYIIKVALYAF